MRLPCFHRLGDFSLRSICAGRHHYLPRGAGTSTIRVERMILSWEWVAMTHNTDGNGLEQPTLDELLPLREAAKLSGLSASHLRLLVRRGDIWGMKLGHNWLTTRRRQRSTSNKS